ncbi:MAG: PTS lactose/cellobiose transporter subunit IIA [Lacticaseibacillus paracasei]|nr:PTS lactose/cellobiose transporter subunit IIA [Lacticaseibacillus paracasei]
MTTDAWRNSLDHYQEFVIIVALDLKIEGDFSTAEAKLKEADSFLSDAHNAQTGMLTEEAQGKKHPVSLLMVHGQDHVMNAITFRDLAGEIVDLYKKLATK